MAEIKIYGTLVNDTNEAIVKSTQVAATKQDGTAATQSAVNADLYAKYAAVGNAYRVKGTKTTIDEVTALTTKAIGDVWNVAYQFTLNSRVYPSGTNVVWTGNEWDPLGGTVDLYSVEEKIPADVEVSPYQGGLNFVLHNRNGVKVLNFVVPDADAYQSGLMSPRLLDKLDRMSSGAQENVIESVKVNGTALSVTGKSVNIDLSPYAKSADTIHVADVTASETNMNLKLRKAAGATPICNVTFNAATTSAAGLMSAADKTRLEASASTADLNAAKALITALTARVAALEAALTLK